ncbi:hypothetical protein CSIM01_00461 [Colletotrichum simmondsii]|uniref:HNH nuclease domain-containing protein n=1 Tax=Colletotrichum simmondsii TaxID=703756 RepID=A0A135SF65_9PEZI|nr:hypothetical protein CSIM01_00461 [Colletotrichum simmondsii]
MNNLNQKGMSDEHLREVNDPLRSSRSSVKPKLYLNNCEARVEILKEIKLMTFLDGETTSSLSDDLHTSYLWAACMSSDLSELENFRDILKESPMEDAGPSLMYISAAVQQLVTFYNTPSAGEVDSAASSPSAKSPRRETAMRSSRSTPTKSSNNPRPLLSPLQNSPGKAGSGGRQQSAQSGSPSPPGNQKKMVDLDSCANLVCLDRIPHRMFNDGRLALQPIDRGTRPSGDHFIRLRVHLLQRQYEPRAWRCDLAQDPYELLENFQLGDDETQEIRLVSSVTQRGISDGHEFDITAKTQEDLPNWDLVDLRYRISLMSHLISAAGVSNEDVDESDGDVSDEEFEDIDVVEGAIRKLEEVADQRSKEVGEDDVA